MKFFHMVTVFFLLTTPFKGECTVAKNHIPSLKKLRSMNGIDPKKYDFFWEKWNLVSVRFREDNREQRFIYANNIAYEALKKKSLIYPDGSAFGKVAFKTRPDKSFPNSLEPFNFSRMQIMVKNAKSFKDMNGWSYWLFLDKDHLSKSKDRERMVACHACHTLVKGKDYIFTTPTFISHPDKEETSFEDFFVDSEKLNISKFEDSLRSLFINKNRKLFIYRMPMFSGSQYESIGPLSKYVDGNKNFMIVDRKKGKFLLAEKLPSTKNCEKRVRILLHRLEKDKKSHQKKLIARIGVVCDGKNTWRKKVTIPRAITKWMEGDK